MPDRPDFDDPRLQRIASLPGRLIVVTTHRRENHGLPLRRVCAAIRELAPRRNGLRVAVVVHPNPDVNSTLAAELHDVKGVHLVPPASYGDMLRLMRRSFLILSDSGGIQEEAPSLRQAAPDPARRDRAARSRRGGRREAGGHLRGENRRRNPAAAR